MAKRVDITLICDRCDGPGWNEIRLRVGDTEALLDLCLTCDGSLLEEIRLLLQTKGQPLAENLLSCMHCPYATEKKATLNTHLRSKHGVRADGVTPAGTREVRS